MSPQSLHTAWVQCRSRLPIIAMPEPIRLSKRVMELANCSRREAEQYIMGGRVLVDDKVVDAPQLIVETQRVVLSPDARLAAPEPATLLVHKPAGAVADLPTIQPRLGMDTQCDGDETKHAGAAGRKRVW